jgi:hypothetical protein
MTTHATAWPNHKLHRMTRGSVIAQAPAAGGLYGLICPPDRWIYIGESEDIRGMLLQHLDSIPSVAGLVWFAYELCDDELRAIRRQALIEECHPICNGEMGDQPPLPPWVRVRRQTIFTPLVDWLEENLSKRPVASLVAAVLMGAIIGLLASL